MTAKKYRVKLTTEEQQELKAAGVPGAGGGIPADPCPHFAAER